MPPAKETGRRNASHTFKVSVHTFKTSVHTSNLIVFTLDLEVRTPKLKVLTISTEIGCYGGESLGITFHLVPNFYSSSAYYTVMTQKTAGDGLFYLRRHLLLPPLNSNRKNKAIVNTLSYRTKHANSKTVTREWWLVDADNQTLGRLASKIATLLIGKHKPSFTNHVDTGDHVVVINAEKIRLTGKKLTDKEVVTYSGYPGGKKVESPKKVLARKPTYLLEEAVRGMLPKTRLGADMYRKLHVHAGDKHNYAAQKPKPIK